MKTKDKILLKTAHYPMSITEIYISNNMKIIYEFNSLINYTNGTPHIWKKYSYTTSEYIKKIGISEFNKIIELV